MGGCGAMPTNTRGLLFIILNVLPPGEGLSTKEPKPEGRTASKKRRGEKCLDL
jgi:hypothetical protein